jgi:hypothetical protein
MNLQKVATPFDPVASVGRLNAIIQSTVEPLLNFLERPVLAQVMTALAQHPALQVNDLVQWIQGEGWKAIFPDGTIAVYQDNTPDPTRG